MTLETVGILRSPNSCLGAVAMQLVMPTHQGGEKQKVAAMYSRDGSKCLVVKAMPELELLGQKAARTFMTASPH